jgi:hypothetical protein
LVLSPEDRFDREPSDELMTGGRPVVMTQSSLDCVPSQMCAH